MRRACNKAGGNVPVPWKDDELPWCFVKIYAVEEEELNVLKHLLIALKIMLGRTSWFYPHTRLNLQDIEASGFSGLTDLE